MTINSNIHGAQETCPFLGCKGDPAVSFVFPTTEHVCYKVKNIDPIRFEHQESFCLRQNYVTCSVFLAKDNITLPEKIRSPIVKERRRRRFLAVMVVLGLIAGLYYFSPGLGALISDLRLIQSNPNSTASVPGSQSSVSPSLTSTKTLAPLEIFLFPTPSVAPNVTSTAGPGLATPFGPENKYVLYLVRDGESLAAIERKFDTSAEILQAINNLPRERALQAGQILVVIPGQRANVGLDVFGVIEINLEIEIEALAANLEVGVEELRKLNSLGPSNMIRAGRWIIYPIFSNHDETP